MPKSIRFVPGWKRLALFATPVVLGVAAVVGAYLYSTSAVASVQAPAVPPTARLDLPAAPGLLVYVSGAVENPGLYRLPRGDRVYDAIAAAGGLSVDADTTRLPNMAARLKDGEQVKVAFAKTSSGTVVGRASLNSATLEELAALPGFTPAFAAEVIDYRANYGGFQNTRELVDILGMSEADYVIARRYVTL
jgi:competence protein ComEA